ncbi:hypothetical protein ACOXVJ_17210 [Pseudomonas knackmussii]|uniref:hypothetical protein n=1 Tax=Pseudomonas knackmussii TaxID=65741 RepID=UPI003BBA47E0
MRKPLKLSVLATAFSVPFFIAFMFLAEIIGEGYSDKMVGLLGLFGVTPLLAFMSFILFLIPVDDGWWFYRKILWAIVFLCAAAALLALAFMVYLLFQP